MVMSESLEELKAIIDNAPEGATHICFDGDYYRCNNDLRNGKQWDFWDSSQIGRVDRWDWVGDMYLVDIVDMRSLSDIKRIIELMDGDK